MTLDERQVDAIIDRLSPGARSREVRPLAGGVSATTLLLTLTSADGSRQRYVVRHRPEETSRGRLSPAREFDLMAELRGQGLPVPRPLLQWSAETFVMEWVDGDATLPPHGVTSCAETLIGIHRQEGAFLDALPPLEDPTSVLEKELTDAGLTLAVRGLMESAPAEQCLLHGDFWPANLLWASGRLAAILDWEHAAKGAPLSDVACARVELEVAEGREAADAFTEHYFQRSGRGSDHLVWWDLYVSASALDSMETWGLAPEVFEHRWKVTRGFRARALEAIAKRFKP